MALANHSEATWLGHPRGLSTLFFTELWERFSYYGMRAILILFMTNAVATEGMGLSDGQAGAIYGLYTAGVYLSCLPGGWLADRLLGQRRAVFWGGVIIAAGHFSLAFQSMATFYLGLMLIVIGTGLLKPNVSAQVGELYPGDMGARRDAGFSIYYMGINIGAFAGPLVVGYLGEKINWHWGFAAAGVGMIFGLLQYRLGGKHLGDAGALRATPQEVAQARKQTWMAGVGAGIVAAVLAILHGTGMLRLSFEGIAGAGTYIIVSVAVLYFTWVIGFGGLTRLERGRVFVIFVFFLAAAMFWSGFEQAGSSMNLFTERLTDRNIFGWEMPTSWLQSVNPLFIIALAPVFGMLWVRLASNNPSLPAKLSYGLVLLGIGFFVLAWGATYTGVTDPNDLSNARLVSPMWLVVTYFMHTCGELCLSPVGLSSVTKLSPRHLVGQMMGMWFMGSALGNLIAGQAAGFIETKPMPELFGTVATITAAFGVLLLLFVKPLRGLIGKLD